MRLEQWLYVIPLRLRSLFGRARVEQELDEELRFHLERETTENIARGLKPNAARREANRFLRDIEIRKEECRDMRRLNIVDNFIQDLRYALRSLRKNPLHCHSACGCEYTRRSRSMVVPGSARSW